MSAPLTRAFLDKAVCSTPGCTETHELYLHASCHLRANVTVRYEAGVLIVACAACDKTVATIAVAE
jgi:hypothetical protein